MEPGFRCYLAEFFGTFVLTFADCGAAIDTALNGPIDLSLLVRVLAPAFAVFAMIFAIGERSGAHINPAVTWAFAARGVFPWRKLPGYWLAQFAGAIAAAALLHSLFGTTGDLGITHPLQGPTTSFVIEITLTMLLGFVILASAHQHKIKGPDAAFPVAATIAVCGIVGKSISGASMNPARSLGPALISGRWDHFWIYILGPLLGAALAVAWTWALHGHPKSKEEQSAEGEKNAPAEQDSQDVRKGVNARATSAQTT